MVADDIVSEAIINLWELIKKQEIPSNEVEVIIQFNNKSSKFTPP